MAYLKTDVTILAELQKALINFQAAHFMSVAGVTVIFYDYLLCLPDEVTYVWPSSASLPACLYYIVRYLPMPLGAVGIYHLANKTSVSFCRGYLTSQLLAQALTYIPATWLLSIRVLALYPPYPKLRYFVYTFLVLTHIAVLTVGSYSFVGVWHSLYWNRYFRDCGGNPPRLLGVALMLLIPFETFLVGLQLYHNFLHRKMLNPRKSAASFHTTTNTRSIVTTGTGPMGTPWSSFNSNISSGQSESILMSQTSYGPSKPTEEIKGKGRCPIAAMKRTFTRKEKLVGEASISFTRIGSPASRGPIGVMDPDSPHTTSFPPSPTTPRSLPPISIVPPSSLLSLPPTPRQPYFPPTPLAPPPPPPPRPVALPLLRTLYMDGTMYFLIVFSMRILTGLVLVFATETLFYLSIFAEYALTTTAVSRLFLHLRMVARNPDRNEESEDEDLGHESSQRQQRNYRRDSEDEEEEEEEESIVGYHKERDIGDEEMG